MKMSPRYKVSKISIIDMDTKTPTTITMSF